MHDLVYDLKRLAERNREGSFATMANRKSMLMLMGEQLVELGYRKLRATELRGRHINRLIQKWKNDNLSPATIRNRLAALRFWAEKVDRVGILSKSNAHYGLAPRETVAQVSKAKALPADQLARITDPYVQWSLQLQQLFGLRKEESIKLRVWQADHGTTLQLQASWTKGGRPRVIPIRTTEQRELLDRLKAWLPTKDASLIPPPLTYVAQMRRYDYQCKQVGLSRMHGLRHQFAQKCFVELTGFLPPVLGGPTSQEMTDTERVADDDARGIISAWLGHNRLEITRAYLG